jgi:hypothetical protein
MKKFKWFIFVFVLEFLVLMPCKAFDCEEDYKNHQTVSRLFFGKDPQNPQTITILNKFLTEYGSASQISPIKLDELCPRSRILLLRSVAQTIFEKSKTERLNHKGKINSPGLDVEISYFFGNAKIDVTYSPNDTDPGNLTIKNLSYQILWGRLNNHYNKNRSTEIVDIFFNGYTKFTPCKQKHLNQTILFFDLEIARNLIRDNLEDRIEIIPIASAILNFLELAKENLTYHISQLFKKPEIKEVILEKEDPEKYAHDSDMEWEEEVCVEWKYRDMGYNPFVSDWGIRKSATKRILTEIHKTKREKVKQDITPETQEQINKKYYLFFGGSYED